MHPLFKWRFSAFIAVAIVSFCAPGWAGPAEDQFAVAAGHYKQKRWKFAADEFRTFLADFPQHANAAKARFYLAESLLQLRQFDAAAPAFREFATAAPQDKLANKARFRAGEAIYLAGHYQQARAALEQFVHDLPDDRFNEYALPYLGDLALRNNEFAKAEHLFSEALRRFAQGAMADDCRFGLAKALEAQGRHEEARRLFLAVAGKPTSHLADQAQFRLAASFYAVGDYEQALAAFHELLEDPRFGRSALRVKAALAEGETLFQLDRLDLARQRFESLLSEQAVAAEARYWFGLVQAAQHDWPAAADSLLNAADRAGTDQKLAAAARFHAADALYHTGKAAEAKAQFDLVLKKWPQSEVAEKCLLGLMQIALATGDHASVDQLAAQFGERYPQTALKPQVDRLVGRSLLARKDYVAAGALFERMVSVAGKEQAADRVLLATAYVGQDRFDDALKTVDAASLGEQPTPDNRELWIDSKRQRSAALVGLNRFADAAAVLEKLLATMPGPEAATWARWELAVCLAKGGQIERAKAVFREVSQQPIDGGILSAAVLALGDAALEQNDPAWASELYEQLAGTKSDFRSRGLWGLARGHAKQGDTSQAVSALNQLLTDYANDPHAPEAALARGQLLEQLNDPEAALKSYRQVIEAYTSSPQLPAAMLAAARLEDRLKRPKEAATLYAELDQKFPQAAEHDAVLYEWAWALRQAGDLKKSDEVFERLRTAMPRSRFWSDAVYRLAERAYDSQDYSRAAQLVAELLAGEPAEQVLPHALYLQAQTAAALNEWPRVPAPLERLTVEFPDNPLVPLARFLVAEAAYRQAEFDRAGELFRELAETTGGRTDKWLPMVPLRRAQILAHEKQWHDALEMAEQIEPDFPEFEQLYEVDYVIGRCQASSGRFDDARAAYRRVVKSESGAKTETAAKAQWMMGETFFHQKNFESALREYLKVEILYDYPQWQAAALFEAAKCHEHLGEQKEAEELFAKVAKSYPDSPLAKDAAQRVKTIEARVQK